MTWSGLHSNTSQHTEGMSVFARLAICYEIVIDKLRNLNRSFVWGFLFFSTHVTTQYMSVNLYFKELTSGISGLQGHHGRKTATQKWLTSFSLP